MNPNPGFSMTDAPQKVINATDTATYFNLMAKLMGEAAPPAPEDAPMLARMARIGLVPGQPFDMSKLDPAVQAALKDTNNAAMKRIQDNKESLGELVNGWVVTKGLGQYGTNYTKRAVVAAFGSPANLQEDAVYPYTTVDSKGQKLTGANRYMLISAKGETPPVRGFWSITMYEVDNNGWWFVPNALNKFTVSARNKLKYNSDGSVTLYFQNESPGKGKEANWLPAPTGKFIQCCGCTGRRRRHRRFLTERGSRPPSRRLIDVTEDRTLQGERSGVVGLHVCHPAERLPGVMRDSNAR